MSVTWFGGPLAGQGTGSVGRTRLQQQMGISGGGYGVQPPATPRPTPLSYGSSRPAATARSTGTRTATQTQQLRTATGPLRVGGDISGPFINSRTVASGGTPQTGGGYQDGTGGAGAPNALEDILRGRIRRIRTLGSGERRDITDAGLERGLGRSQESMMERQRQREMEGITGAERDFQAGEFENQRAVAGDERRFALEREKLQQELELQRQRGDLERELTERRFQQESSQNELERNSALQRASVSGGGGDGVDMSELTGRRPGGYGGAPTSGGFSSWSGVTPSARRRGPQAGASAATSDLANAFSLGDSTGSSQGSSFRRTPGGALVWGGYGA